jgi:hypothetical protein
MHHPNLIVTFSDTQILLSIRNTHSHINTHVHTGGLMLQIVPSKLFPVQGLVSHNFKAESFPPPTTNNSSPLPPITQAPYRLRAQPVLTSAPTGRAKNLQRIIWFIFCFTIWAQARINEPWRHGDQKTNDSRCILDHFSEDVSLCVTEQFGEITFCSFWRDLL